MTKSPDVDDIEVVPFVKKTLVGHCMVTLLRPQLWGHEGHHKPPVLFCCFEEEKERKRKRESAGGVLSVF